MSVTNQSNKVSELELKDKYIDWIDDNFPKGDKGRGKAAVLLGLVLADIQNLIAKRVLEGRIDELEQLIADTLEPEQFGSTFTHAPVREFTKQQKEFIQNRIKELRAREDV